MKKIKILVLISVLTFFVDGYSQSENVEKSVYGALLRSMILPGWGEYYAQNTAAANWTFSAEVMVWSSYFFFEAKSAWLEDDYKNVAMTYASVNSKTHDKQFWIDVGGSHDIYAHNEYAARSRDADAIYTDTETYYWYWQNNKALADYNHIRIQSGRFKDYAKIVVSGAILTRIVSSVIAVRSVKRYNRKIKVENSYGFKIQPILDSHFNWVPYASLEIRF